MRRDGLSWMLPRKEENLLLGDVGFGSKDQIRDRIIGDRIAQGLPLYQTTLNSPYILSESKLSTSLTRLIILV